MNTPEGWKLVPVEPTPEMQSAAERYAGYHNRVPFSAGYYRAMLAAAPTPPEPPENATLLTWPAPDLLVECAQGFVEGWTRSQVTAITAAYSAAYKRIKDVAEPCGGLEGAPSEERLEEAYWRFDARHKGLSQWRNAPMTVRDAFKQELRNAVAAESIRTEMRLVAKSSVMPGSSPERPEAELATRQRQPAAQGELTADAVFRSNEIMAINAGLGLRMDQLMDLVRAVERLARGEKT